MKDKKGIEVIPQVTQNVNTFLTTEGKQYDQCSFSKQTIWDTGVNGALPALAVYPGVYIQVDETLFLPANERPFYLFLAEQKKIIPLYFAALVQEQTTGALLAQMNVPFYNVLNPNPVTSNFSKTTQSQLKYQFLHQFAQTYQAPVSGINWSKDDFLELEKGSKIIWGGNTPTALSRFGPGIPPSGQFQSFGPFAAGVFNISVVFNYLVLL